MPKSMFRYVNTFLSIWQYFPKNIATHTHIYIYISYLHSLRKNVFCFDLFRFCPKVKLLTQEDSDRIKASCFAPQSLTITVLPGKLKQ